MNILLIGPQASGKGTQAEKLVNKFNLAYVEMGGLLRKISNEETPLGYKIREIINVRNVLVPDDLIIQIVNDYLARIGVLDGIVFDGFPRVLSQAEYFEKFLTERGKKIDLVIYLSIPRKVTFNRLANRRICEGCGKVFNLITKPPKVSGTCDFCGGKLIIRADETPKKIENRLKEFEKQTKPLVEFYRKRGILEEIDGNRPIEVIFKDILARLKKRGLTK